MQELRVIDPVLTNLDPEFEVNLFIDQIPDFLAGGRADGLDAFPRPADDHGLVRGLRHIDGGMDEHAIVFLVPHFNVHGDGIGDFLIQLFEKLLADDLGGHELHGGRGKLIFGELRLAFGQVGADKLKELLHTVAAQGRRREDFRLGEHLGHGLQQGQHTRLVMEQVDLVHHNDDGALLFGQRLDEGREIALHEIGLAQVQIAVDDEAMFNEIRNYIRQIEPEKEKIVKLYKGNVPIFDNFDISKQIKSLFAKYVSLKRGAYLIIERTEAMNVIDVNSGNRTKAEDNQEQTAMDVNLAAAKEIARQLRLRDLGGIVIIDFIDLHKAQNKQALFDEMVKLMATDKAKHTVLPLTKFGLMQITRQRVRPVAVESVSDVCPTCNGSGKIEPTVLLDKKIENQISFLTQDRGHKFIKLVVSPYVAAFLRKGLWSLRRRWEWKYKVRLEIAEDQSIGIVEIHYHDKKDNDLITK